ncbi:hypothetical protein [Streptomyces sp. NBC_01190]|uniref:ATP-dependent DNA ligase n=1 Tax=Streptomyces sp. NBC_01190 TaxID=2903767 RepID=UPI0038654717|nr:hypothetical protein OG519_00260 [Streptomyces sp. NBC_01190]
MGSWDGSRLAFERLRGRLNRRTAAAARLAEQRPAHFVVFDLLRRGADEDLSGRSYAARRTALEHLFAEDSFGSQFAL